MSAAKTNSNTIAQRVSIERFFVNIQYITVIRQCIGTDSSRQLQSAEPCTRNNIVESQNKNKSK